MAYYPSPAADSPGPRSGRNVLAGCPRALREEPRAAIDDSGSLGLESPVAKMGDTRVLVSALPLILWFPTSGFNLGYDLGITVQN